VLSLFELLISAPKSCAGRVLPSHRLAVLHLVSLECAIRVFHFPLLSPEPALKFSLSPASDVCFLLVIFLLRFLLQVLVSVLFLSCRFLRLEFSLCSVCSRGEFLITHMRCSMKCVRARLMLCRFDFGCHYFDSWLCLH
jgi:hypothetical protein